MKKSLIIIALAVSCLSSVAQRPGYDVSFYQIFDNREYFSEYGFSQTIFGARLDATFRFSSFFLSPSFLLYHLARSYDVSDASPIRDNGVGSLVAGYAMDEQNNPLSFELSAGYVVSYDRLRPADLEWGRGWIANVDILYTIFGFRGVYYFGTPVVFAYGDPFYRAGEYGRLDFYADPFRIKNIDSKIGWNIHYVPGEGLYHS